MEKDFVNVISSYINPNVSLDKLKLLTEAIKVAEDSNAMCEIQSFPFITNKTPIEQGLKNLEVFKSLDKNMQGKYINLTDFLEKNVNLY